MAYLTATDDTGSSLPPIPGPTESLDPYADPPVTPVAEIVEVGEHEEGVGKLARNSVRLDALARANVNAYCVASGLTLGDADTGLTLTIAAGVAIIDGVVVLAEETELVLTDESSCYVWLQRGEGGQPTPTFLTDPEEAPDTPAAYLGMVPTTGGDREEPDYSGVLYLRGGTLYRRSGDSGAMTDTPPELILIERTESGLWAWDGERRWSLRGGYQVVNVEFAHITLSDSLAEAAIIECIGDPVGARNLILPTLAGLDWTIYNHTDGSFAVTAKTSGGSGVAIAAGKRARVYCDGTNILLCETDLTAAGALSKTTDDSIADGVDYAVGTSTGTKLGTATNQKLALWGQTPTARPAALTAANAGTVNSGDAATDAVIENLRTRLGELETRLQAFGFLP